LVEDRPGQPQNILRGSTPLELFQLFFTEKDITVLIEQSNPRALSRGYKPLTMLEFYRYLGCLIHMGVYKYPEIRDYWRRDVAGAQLGLRRDRFNEIQAVFTFRNPDTCPKQPNDPWWFRVEPLASSIRASCQRYWIPGANITVDEGMVAYHGHTRHTVKAPHKPIKQGFKIWALGDHGYIYNWLWYSRIEGTEATRRSRTLAETQTLVLNLAHSLPRDLSYTFYLDNLFTNVPLAKELLKLNIGITGTARKTALGYPKWLVQLKEQGRGKNKALEWGAIRAEVVDDVVLCFAWQDNNTVLGITTAYKPEDLVLRNRKRPAETSTNAAIVRPVFGDSYTKELAIPRLIDAYNHHMGGVDIANQLRANYSTHTRRQKRHWKALFLWLLDLAITNAYLLSPRETGSRAHRKFLDDLAKSLMDMPLESAVPPETADLEPTDFEPAVPPETADLEQTDFQPTGFELADLAPTNFVSTDFEPTDREPSQLTDRDPEDLRLPEPADPEEIVLEHTQEKRAKSGYCVYCSQHKEDWKPHKHSRKNQYGQVSRAFGADLTNTAPTPGGKDTRGYRIRGSRTPWYCRTCNVALCKKGECWNLWHTSAAPGM